LEHKRKQILKIYSEVIKWLIIVVMAILVGWQYMGDINFPKITLIDALEIERDLEAFQKNLQDIETRIKKSVDILNKKQMEVQALEEEVKGKFAIRERELRTQVKTIETKLQKLRSELNFGLHKVEGDVARSVDVKFKTLWTMINSK
jgi:septal ring factor EnvC (AmiA/AmiB activator)|tara:strand:- start:1309 stop:1749 length:441 start_codon:yes stop_codon:yes gene_type:complete